MRIILVIFFIIAPLLVFANIIIVDNNVPSIGQFTSLVEACSAANVGDKIYLLPSATQYEGVTITKRLEIVGGGWGFSFSVDGIHNTEVGIINFDSGADNSILKGISIPGYPNGLINVNAEGVRIEYCNVGPTLKVTANSVIIQKNNLNGICIGQNVHNFNVNRNIIRSGYPVLYGSNYFHVGIHLNNCQGTISNNIFNIYEQAFNNYILGFSGVSNVIVINNTFGINTIPFINAPDDFYSNCINNIIFGSLISEYYPNNILYQSGINIFVDYSNGNYHLAPGSPAIGAGQDGVDCGAYGGSTPLIDKINTPDLPSVIQLLTPKRMLHPGQPISLTVKAKNN